MGPSRATLLSVVLAACSAAVVLAFGAVDVFWSDFSAESWPALIALTASGPDAFLAAVPGYAPFVTAVSAPAALLVDGVHGLSDTGDGMTAVLALAAVPGLAALAALGVALARSALRPGAAPAAWILAVALSAGSPLAVQALRYGHPEDVLAAAASVGAVLLARDGRLLLSGAVLAVAIATKQWAVLAVAPVLLAAPRRGWLPAAVGLAGGAAALLPFVALRPEAHGSYVGAAVFFHPQQVWWLVGVPATPEFIVAGHGTRMGPAWLAPIPHPLIVGLAAPLAALWWQRAGRAGRDRHDALLLLALLFLGRCALDPWNLVYYQLPLVLALLAWEVPRARGLPVLTLAVTAATWASFVAYDARGGWAPFALYMAWVLPLALLLGRRLLGRPAAAPGRRACAIGVRPVAASA